MMFGCLHNSLVFTLGLGHNIDDKMHDSIEIHVDNSQNGQLLQLLHCFY